MLSQFERFYGKWKQIIYSLSKVNQKLQFLFELAFLHGNILNYIKKASENQGAYKRYVPAHFTLKIDMEKQCMYMHL